MTRSTPGSEKSPRRHARTAGLTAVLVLALASTLGGCAVDPGPQPLAPGSPDTQTASPGDAGSARGSGQNASSAPDSARDALALTGPTEAADAPDVQPIVKNPTPRLPATVKDADGKRIRVKDADRVLALDLYGTLSDTMIGLGLADRLVGRSNSDTQKVLSSLPVVTKDGHDLNVEAVLNLKPTLVLENETIGSAAKYRQLAAAGITVVRFEPTPSIEKIGPMIQQVGEAVGLSAPARQLAEHTEREMHQADRRIAELASRTPQRPRAAVLYVRGRAGVFFILGKDYGAADLISHLRLEDAAAEAGITDLKPANAESLVQMDPQIVLAMRAGVKSAGGVDTFLSRPGLKATTAGEHRRVITAADGQLLSYGPRTPANLVALAEAIYTEGS